jgi:hypothetical protein
MGCSLPPEMLDYITGHLRGEPTTLRACCLVSTNTKSPLRPHRIPRPSIPHRTVEGVPGSLQLSRSPHAQSLHSRPLGRYRCRYGCGWLDSHLSQRRTLAISVHWQGGYSGLSSHFTDSRPPSGHSVWIPPASRFSTSSVPFPFSKICRWILLAPGGTPMDGTDLRPHPNSPGPLS